MLIATCATSSVISPSVKPAARTFFPYKHVDRSADPLKPRVVARGLRIVATDRFDAASVPLTLEAAKMIPRT